MEFKPICCSKLSTRLLIKKLFELFGVIVVVKFGVFNVGDNNGEESFDEDELDDEKNPL